MRVLLPLMALMLSSSFCYGQDDDRILDEVAENRLVDEAEDFELISEFRDLEGNVAVNWVPRLAARQPNLEDGVLVPFAFDGANRVLAIWPFMAACENTYQYTVITPVVEQQTRTITKTIYRPETRTRMVDVTKTRQELQTRTKRVQKVDEDGKPFFEDVVETYTVEVPYTEQIAQEYTVMVPVTVQEEVAVDFVRPVPVTKTATMTQSCLINTVVEIDAVGFPLFRGDRTSADWLDFQAELEAKGQLYVVAFEAEENWIDAWDSVLSSDAYVMVLDQIDTVPRRLEAALPELIADKTVHPLPLLGRRSEIPEHQFAFSPYVMATTYRPQELASIPLLPSQWVNASRAVGLPTKSDWIYLIEMDEAVWKFANGEYSPLLAVERNLAAGGSFIASSPEPPWSAWRDVFRETVPVYTSVESPAADKPTDAELLRQIELVLDVKQALKRRDVLTAVDLLTRVNIPELLDVNVLCHVAYLLHQQGLVDEAAMMAIRALQLERSPLDRDYLIKDQGNSRAWLESIVLEYPLRVAVQEKLNAAGVRRMSVIYDRLMRAREVPPVATSGGAL
jgi:hypothetical protein